MSKIEEAMRKAGPAPGAVVSRVRPSSEAQPDIEGATPVGGAMVGLGAAEQIARMREASPRSHSDLEARRLIDEQSSVTSAGAAFRQLRTSLLQISKGRNFALMVSSVCPDGGASFVARNLAAAFALDPGKTALLLNCNLPRPGAGAGPGSDDLAVAPDAAPGLADYLQDSGLRPEQILYPSGVARLRVIPGGNRGATAVEHFTAPRMERLLKELRDRYAERYLIMDSPPIGESADSRILADLCDFVLLVVPYGGASPARISAAVDAVPDGKLVGCVMNGQPEPLFWLH